MPTVTLNILLVDDSRSYLTAVRRLLDGLPGIHIVGQANSGHDALRLARQLRPDVMLLDVAMPNMNGLEVARTLREWPCPPRIVFVSMHDSADYRRAASGLGALAYVSKDAVVVELRPLLQRLMSGDQLDATP